MRIHRKINLAGAIFTSVWICSVSFAQDVSSEVCYTLKPGTTFDMVTRTQAMPASVSSTKNEVILFSDQEIEIKQTMTMDLPANAYSTENGSVGDLLNNSDMKEILDANPEMAEMMKDAPSDKKKIKASPSELTFETTINYAKDDNNWIQTYSSNHGEYLPGNQAGSGNFKTVISWDPRCQKMNGEIQEVIQPTGGKVILRSKGTGKMRTTGPEGNEIEVHVIETIMEATSVVPNMGEFTSVSESTTLFHENYGAVLTETSTDYGGMEMKTTQEMENFVKP